jgi:hypothetical protein
VFRITAREPWQKIPQFLGLSLLGLGAAGAQETASRKPLKIMIEERLGIG